MNQAPLRGDAFDIDCTNGMGERVTTSNLADHLDGWSAWTVATLLATAGLALMTIDRAFPAVGMGPLYIPIIALAGWRLGLRASCLVAIIASLLNIFPHRVDEFGLDPDVALARGITRLSTYAFIIALVHALRSAFDRERVRATHDALTGALNRAAFDREVEALLDDGGADRRAIALALIDVDDFKRINDTHGHAAGDHVLRVLTDGATRTLGKLGHLYRLGGDEFAVLMPVASVTAGRPAIERVHEDILIVLGASLYPTTISMGALVFEPRSSLDRTELMLVADQYMYGGKAAGKGRLRFASLQPSPVAADPTAVFDAGSLTTA